MEGGRLGPPLTQVGYRRPAAFLQSTLLDPAGTIPEGYAFVDLSTRNGRRLTGIRLDEDTYSIVVRDLSDNLHSFWKSDLAELRKDNKRTPMPSYESVLTSSELDDLVTYLVSVRSAR